MIRLGDYALQQSFITGPATPFGPLAAGNPGRLIAAFAGQDGSTGRRITFSDPAPAPPFVDNAPNPICVAGVRLPSVSRL